MKSQVGASAWADLAATEATAAILLPAFTWKMSRYDRDMRIERVGPRTWAVALLVGLSVADPGIVTQWGVYVGLVVWLTGSPGRFRTDRVFWALVAATTWTGLTTLWAINPTANSVATTAAALAATFLLARDAIRTQQQLRTVAYAYLLASVVAIVRIVAFNFVPALDTGRYTIDGINANYLGYALCGALAIVVLLWQKASTRARLALLAASSFIAYGLYLTGTRGAFLGAVCLGAWLVISAASRRPPIRTLVAITAVFALVITTGILDAFVQSLEFGERATGDWSGRLVLWPIARELWEQNWLIGAGPNAMRVYNPFLQDAHSVFLEIGSAQGIVGVVLFALFVSLALGHGSRGADPRTRGLIIGAFIATSIPAYITGAWETAPAAMMMILIFSRVGSPAGVEAGPEQPRLRPSANHEVTV